MPFGGRAGVFATSEGELMPAEGVFFPHADGKNTPFAAALLHPKKALYQCIFLLTCSL